MATCELKVLLIDAEEVRSHQDISDTNFKGIILTNAGHSHLNMQQFTS